MASGSPANRRAFVRRQTRLVAVPDLGGLRLHLADDVTEVLWRSADETGDRDPPLPFWAFAWAGGLAVARYLLEHPEEVAGRRVLDVATGSGLCAIAAMRAGAASAQAVDPDPLSEAAVAINARANGVSVRFTRADVLELPVPPASADVILAGDVCYEETMSERILGWLRVAAASGIRVLVGDPGRAYLPADLDPVAAYAVRTTRELESTELKRSSVFTIGRPRGLPPKRCQGGCQGVPLPAGRPVKT